MKHTEFRLQAALCRYVSLQYPEVDFLSDTVASVKLTKQQAGRNSEIQKKGFKTPDFILFEPRGAFSGLFIELKIDTPFKRNGEIKASQNDHLKNQQMCLERLRLKGYRAEFAWSFEMAKKIIDEYLSVKS